MSLRVAIAFTASLVLTLGCSSEGETPTDAGAPACEAGAYCGNDCSEISGPCWGCGTLYYDQNCDCLDDPSTSLCRWPTGCDNPEPALEGENCGDLWWCDRDCAAGLSCDYEADRSDAGMFGSFVKICKQL